jgi:hypothetical protein
MSDEELKKAQFFFDFVAKADEIATQSNERILKKILGVLTLASALIPAVFGLGYFVTTQTKEWIIFLPIFVSLVMFLGAIARGIFLLKPKFFFCVNVLDLIGKYKDESLPVIINKSAVTWADIVGDNHDAVNSRGKGINQMLILIALGFLILALAFLGIGISMVI